MLKKALLGVVLFAAIGRAFAEDAKPPVVNQAPTDLPANQTTTTTTNTTNETTTGFVASAKQFYNNNTTLVQAGGAVAVLAIAYVAYKAWTAEQENNEWNS